MHCFINLKILEIMVALTNTFKTIYFSIFDSLINYTNFISRQNPNSELRIIALHKKALTIINNHPRNSHWGLLFKKSNMLNFEDKILFGSIIFISKSTNILLPPVFQNWFMFCSEIHTTMTVLLSIDKLLNPLYRTDSPIVQICHYMCY